MSQTSCRFDPSLIEGPIGMFHCPDCGIMVIAGFPHLDDEACKYQLEEWEAPVYDVPEGEAGPKA